MKHCLLASEHRHEGTLLYGDDCDHFFDKFDMISSSPPTLIHVARPLTPLYQIQRLLAILDGIVLYLLQLWFLFCQIQRPVAMLQGDDVKVFVFRHCSISFSDRTEFRSRLPRPSSIQLRVKEGQWSCLGWWRTGLEGKRREERKLGVGCEINWRECYIFNMLYPRVVITERLRTINPKQILREKIASQLA